jgi:toxin YhaV
MELNLTMSRLVFNGWEILFHPQLFAKQYQELVDLVNVLQQRLSPDEFKTHATVKLFAAITLALEFKIPADPFASYFALQGALKQYKRLKKMGLPNRYRLFFRVFDTPERKAVVVLWLGFPRKEGAKDDCYTVFTKMVMRGEFPDTIDALLGNSILPEE